MDEMSELVFKSSLGFNVWYTSRGCPLRGLGEYSWKSQNSNLKPPMRQWLSEVNRTIIHSISKTTLVEIETNFFELF